MSFAKAQTYCFKWNIICFSLALSRLCGHNSPYARWIDFYIIRVVAVIYHKEIVLRHGGGWPVPPTLASQINGTPSDPTINPSPTSMSCIFFYRAQTICCLKLAIAFDAQTFPDRVLHRSSMGLSHCTQHRVVIKFYLWCVSHAHVLVYGRCNNLLIPILVYWIALVPQCMSIHFCFCNSRVFLWWSFRCLVWLRLRLILGLTRSTHANLNRSWCVSSSAFWCRSFVLLSCTLFLKILLIFCLCTCVQIDYLWLDKQIPHILRVKSQLGCLDIAMSCAWGGIAFRVIVMLP